MSEKPTPAKQPTKVDSSNQEKAKIVWVPSSEATCPGWMTTFGDAMSLLLCFFVLLLTFSTKEDARLMDVLGVIKGALSPLKAVQEIQSGELAAQFSSGNISEAGPYRQRRVEPEKISPVNLRNYEFTEKRLELERMLKAIGFQHFVSLDVLNEGISLGFDVDKVFVPGSDQLRVESFPVLQGFAILCTGVDNEVRLVAKIPSSVLHQERLMVYQAWQLAMRRLHVLHKKLSEGFAIPTKRVSFGVVFCPDKASEGIEMVLVERPGGKLVKASELVTELLNLQKEK